MPIDAEQREGAAAFAQCRDRIEVGDIRNFGEPPVALMHTVGFALSARRDRAAYRGVGIHVEGVAGGSAKDLSLRFPDTGELNDAGHIGDWDDIRSAEQHVKESSAATATAMLWYRG